jgi:outer membrane lipoprotein SlyB
MNMIENVENVVIFRFTQQAAAYQTLSELRQLDGTVRSPDGVSTGASEGTLIGGVVGSAIGLLGGPLGVVLGWGAGTLAGSDADWRRAANRSGVVALVADEVSAGNIVLVAELVEHHQAPVNYLAMRFDAVLERRPATQVRAEVKAVCEAQKAAEKDAAKARRRERKAELDAKVTARTERIKEKFQGSAA